MAQVQPSTIDNQLRPEGGVTEFVSSKPSELPASVFSKKKTEIAPAVAAQTAITRIAALDALRGLFILLMNWGFTIPSAVFADWMYHRQYPPSAGGDYVPLAGLAWRDVTFGAFLFTMAASIPLTMTARLEQDGSPWSVVRAAIRRWIYLFAFALIIGHANPNWTNNYTPLGNTIAIAGYALCFLCFTRPLKSWKKPAAIAVQVAGWAGVVALFLAVPKLFDIEFSFSRRDDVIALLAFGALAGILLWLVTRTKPMARLAVLACLVAFRFASRETGWAHELWGASPVPWLFHFNFLDMLLVMIPGTVAGDMLVDWSKEARAEGVLPKKRWSSARLGGIALLALAVEPVVVAGTYNRWILSTTIALAVMTVAGAWLMRNPATANERFLARLLPFAAMWLFIGVLMEPLNGGMKKVPGTVSYYFAVAGIAMCLFAAFVIFLDFLKVGRTLARPFSDVGQNPMMGYMVLPMFVIPLLVLSGVYRHNITTPEAALVRSALLLFIVAVFVGFFSRRKIFWRT